MKVGNYEVRSFSLSRLRNYFSNKTPFGIVSAFRSENILRRNQELSSDLAIGIRELGYGYVRLIGGYVETLEDGRLVNVVEASYLIPHITSKALLKLGRDYEQETVLYFSGEDFDYLDPRTKQVLERFQHTFSTLKEAISSYFSQIRGKGRKFSFLKEVVVNRYPT